MDSVAFTFFLGSAVLFVLSLLLALLEGDATRAFTPWAYSVGPRVLRAAFPKAPVFPVPSQDQHETIETPSARAREYAPSEILAHAKTRWLCSTLAPIKLQITLQLDGGAHLVGRASLGATCSLLTLAIMLVAASSLVALHASTREAVIFLLGGFALIASATAVLLYLEVESAKQAARELLEPQDHLL
jgi:hypothetical protein